MRKPIKKEERKKKATFQNLQKQGFGLIEGFS